MREATRAFYDHTGVVLHGAWVQMIELRKDRDIVSQGYTCHMLLCVLPTQAKAGGADSSLEALRSTQKPVTARLQRLMQQDRHGNPDVSAGARNRRRRMMTRMSLLSTPTGRNERLAHNNPQTY